MQRSIPVPVTGMQGAETITAGRYFSCARTAGGAVQCWGDNFYGQLGDDTTTNRPTPVALQF